MLTTHDLTVLRAAVTYFEEELGPYGVEAMRPYFDEPPPKDWKPCEIVQLREQLQTFHMRYACCDLTTTHVIHAELIATIEAARSIADNLEGQVGTLLFARDR